MKKLLFITTYKARDFEGNGLIGYYLKKNYNIEVVYTSGYKILDKIITHKPVGIVFDHLTWNHKVKLLNDCKALGLKTIYYPTEGYYPDMTSFDYGVGLKFTDNPKMTKYLLWGSDMMDRIKCLDVFANQLDSFVITGAARFDYYLNEDLKKSQEKNDCARYEYLNLIRKNIEIHNSYSDGKSHKEFTDELRRLIDATTNNLGKCVNN